MRGATWRVRRVALLLVLPLLLAGCTYENREPGLFGRTPGAGPQGSETSEDASESTAAIPVLGEATWTPADPRGIAVRIAVHSVRRVPDGTVLDWSITPLRPPDREPGEPIEGGLDLGIDEQTDVALVDGAADRVYRPLVSRDGSRQCLCTAVRLAEDELALDVPILLQVTYPKLPESLRVVDVSVGPVPVFSRVPVTAVGQVAAPIGRTDLARPAEPVETRARTPDFAGPADQRFAVEIHAVLASGTLTSVVWTLEAVSRGPGPGPGLAPVLTRDGDWRVAPMRLDPGGRAKPACLCADPADWRDYLTEPGRRITVVTNFGEIPRGTTSLDVVFPGGPELRGIGVTPASDGAFRAAGAARTPRRSWTYRRNRPQPAWRLYAWPTPPPAVDADGFTGRVDPILD